MDELGRGSFEGSRFFVPRPLVFRYRGPALAIGGTSGCSDDRHLIRLVSEREKPGVVDGGAGIEKGSNRRAACTRTNTSKQLVTDDAECGVTPSDDHGEQFAAVDIERTEDLFDPHVLVTNGMKALFDLEFPRKPRDRMFVDTDVNSRRPPQLGLGAADEIENSANRRCANQATQKIAPQDCGASCQDGETAIVERLEVEHTRDTQYRFEEERQDQSSRFARPKSTQALFSHAMQPHRLAHQEERTSVDGLAKKGAASRIDSSRRQPRPNRATKRRSVSRSIVTPNLVRMKASTSLTSDSGCSKRYLATTPASSAFSLGLR